MKLEVPIMGELASPVWIKRAALYPYNKEMHALVRARTLLNFEIVGFADPVGKGLLGKDAGEAIDTPALGVPIVPRLTTALENADTLIWGMWISWGE